MVQTEKGSKLTKEQLLSRLVELHKQMKKAKDEENASKVQQLIKKLHESEYMIGFCGHFSAGKSSMINELIGENLLPASPIPTSANLVKVKAGKDYARVYYKHGEIIEYPAPYDYDVIKSYCKDGDTVNSIEISHSTSKLPKGVTVMDTPGIDSTDDAHRVSTESALHLADLLFYVMDYNHVQSELNFLFTRELTERNKEVYLVINQIDKHRDIELEFSYFKQGVQQAFQDWNVEPKGIYYTSLRDQENVNNQLSQLKNLIATKLGQKEELLLASVDASAKQLIQEHLYFLEDTQASTKELYLTQLQGHSEQEMGQLEQDLNRIKEKQEQGKKKVTIVEEDFLSQLNTILDNAYLMPFSTRDLAKNYLESCQSDFKVGMFFSKAKTEKERNDRLTLFYEDFKEKVSSQLEWHIKEFSTSFLKQQEMTQLIGDIQHLTVHLEKDLLASIVKPGAGLTGDYILTYTSDVSNEIKKRYRSIALDLFREISGILKERMQAETSKLQTEMSKLEAYLTAYTNLQQLKNDLNLQERELISLIEGETEIESVDVLTHVEELVKEKVTISSTDQIILNQKEESQIGAWKSEKVEAKRKVDGSTRVMNTVNNLVKAKNKIESITGLSSIAADMGEKATRLKNRHFTVALFGAFSAGKSSFANALMGEYVLPVSPNPTTATINKVVPPTDENKHGTVIVKIKSEKQLLQDLKHSLQVLGEDVTTLTDALDSIKSKLSNRTVDAKEKPHFAFLQAVTRGFAGLSEHLGEIIAIDIDGFKEYVANEEKACFVEWIELYYDCELTRQGITLVDTPGADSINARHTGVAFNYIKNADAILFVTYYNHAFSKADREFLIQLGRVKDTFSMDKMFFIINAADLANDPEELETVEEYVGSELVRYGIRKPRLYSLSSQLALKEKLGEEITDQTGVLNTSGISSFEADFKAFITEELTEMAIVSALNDMIRAKKVLQDYISSATEDQEIKATKLSNAVQSQLSIQNVIANLEVDFERNSVIQEVEELTYYIKQRVFLRYPDFFKESFNPAVIREDAKDLKKVLQGCLRELIEAVGFDLAQEMRATTLRIEKFIFKVLNEIQDTMIKKIHEKTDTIQLSEPTNIVYSTPEFENGLHELDLIQFKKALSMFKNPKSFFEKNEKKVVMEEIEVTLQQPVSDYLEDNKQLLKAIYEEDFTKGVLELKNKALKEVNEYFDGIKLALSENIDVEELREIVGLLEKMAENDAQ
jgi:small GTP-binding protein